MLDAAADGGTVTLARDVPENVTVTGGTLTVDLNGKTWHVYEDVNSNIIHKIPLTVTGGSVTLKNLAECADGKVELVVYGEHQQYADCEQALVNAAGKYVVKSISARADTLVIELTDHSVVQNDLNADWVKDQEKETGEAISFF